MRERGKWMAKLRGGVYAVMAIFRLSKKIAVYHEKDTAIAQPPHSS